MLLITDAKDLPEDTDIMDRLRLLQFLPPGSFELLTWEDTSDPDIRHVEVSYPLAFVEGVIHFEGTWYVRFHDDVPGASKAVPLHDIISLLRISIEVKNYEIDVEVTDENTYNVSMGEIQMGTSSS